ncbi:MAG: ABC transporter ATP-binding protein [Phycisphaerae bacterium]
MAQTSVTVEHVSKHFGTTVALDDVSVDIPAGEIFFLLGPSGCGKSTLLRIIAGLLPPTLGRVLFSGRDVTDLGTERRNAVMVFQSYALWPHMTVEDNVRFGLEVRGASKADQVARVAEALDLVRMTPYAKRKPNELSGGQQQRVALARALVVRPDCLLLDEPLSNLDAKLRLEMRTEIRRICRASGLTAIYVTHDQKEALSIADRMAVLNNGKIEQVGRPQDLYRKPDSTFVASFMGETNFLPATFLGTTQIPPMPNQPADVHLAGLDTPIGRLIGAHAPAGLREGDKVTLSIRPEAILVGVVGESDVPNSFDVTVHDTLYLGEVAQHQVTVNKEGRATTLKAFELNPQILARDSTQQQAQIFIHPRDVVVLKG